MDGDGWKLHREPSREHDPSFHSLDEAGHVPVARIEVAESVGDADDRPVQGIIRKAGGLDECLAEEQREARVTVACEVAAQAGLRKFRLIAHDATSSNCCWTGRL
jgi:hypothetical protein